MNELRNQDRAARAVQGREVGDRNSQGESTLMPPVDVVEDAQAITLYADLPGVRREALHLEIEAGTLTIDARLDLSLPQGLQSSHTEVGFQRFRRSFTLSKELDVDRVAAEMSHGVLKLTIPKAEHAKPRRIAVQFA